MNATTHVSNNITPMSAQEARECIDAIIGNSESLPLMLLELHRRQGWAALGYSSWEDCTTAEFGKSRSYVFRLLAAAQVEENLVESTIVDLKAIPVSQLTELAKLSPVEQAEGLLRAEQIAQAEGKKRNAAHIAQAVREIKRTPSGTTEEDGIQTHTDDQQEPPEFIPTTVEPKLERRAEYQSSSLLNTDNCPDSSDVCITLLSNIPLFGNEQLQQLIKDAKQIIRDAKQELNQRQCL